MKNTKVIKQKQSFGTMYQKYGILLVLLIEVIFFTFMHQRFLTPDNLLSVGRQISFIGISAIGMTIVMVGGGIDISVGSMLALSGVLAAKFTVEMGVPLPVSIIITLALGIVFGMINGFTTSVLRIPPLISTLAMQTMLRGIAFLVTGALPIKNIPDSFKYLGQGYLGGVFPLPLFIMIFLFLIGCWIMHRSYFGRWIYAVGGNIEAARLSGINTTKVQISTYALCSLFTAFAGVLMAGRLGSGQPSIGEGFEMDVLTATVLGGVSVSGGRGRIMNVLIGALIMGILSTGMIMIGLNEYWQWVVKGLVLIFAVTMSNLGTNSK
ncbi:ABC transporter permease [Aminicella lysinilytica]|uniref:ABC transporter permease n=1 Tax=Aminicella lysinilytica TaxID=433323 RepID=UPI0026F0A040|nr:ABC transporter permease [Aminicella lysinilytica]